jgi:hypothetical protein
MTATAWTSAALGTWGKPPDDIAWIALAAAAAFAVVAVSPSPVLAMLGIGGGVDREQRQRFVSATALAAAFLSLGYVAFYLRGGPRIIDATSYFLEARGIAHGKFAWSVPSPTASFRGRFLLFHNPDKLSVIFPPGYPVLLAAGFLVGAPMVIGPLLGASLVFATYWLTRELLDPADPNVDAIAMLAAVFSLACVALRYHTADTMAHGASALGITLALACAFRGKRTGSLVHFALAGLSLGWVMATRPVSSLPVSIAVFALCATRLGSPVGRVVPGNPRALLAVLAAMVPGFVLLCVAQHAQTGSWFASSQEAYYAVSDGPPGCFRYGFGKDTGCLYEHGDFVRAHLGSGSGSFYGLGAALGTTARRLKMHIGDVLNFEPLVLLVLWPLLGRMRTRAGLALWVVLGQILVYAPFYFDGNYPGGGARFFADVLPLEHALAAMGVSLLLPRIAFVRRALAALALVCAGFAVHGAFEHEQLAHRDGGRPMFEPDTVRDAQITKGLLFFDTDHGYDLALVPGVDPTKDVLAVRLRGDDHDRLVYERFDRPQAHAYRLTSEGPAVQPWVEPGASADLWRFEAEADWPPFAQSAGWAEPAWFSSTCASQERALTLHAVGGEKATVTFELPVPKDGRWLVTPRVIRSGGHGKATLKLAVEGRPAVPDDDKLVWEWLDSDATLPTGPPTCSELTPREATLLLQGQPAPAPAPDAHAPTETHAVTAKWVLTATGGSVSLDRTTMRMLH